MKKFKSALSLLTALIMVFAIMPGAMANEIAAITAEDIARYGDGNKSTSLVQKGMKVSYGDGENMNSAPYLVDGFYYSVPEVRTYNLDLNNTVDRDVLNMYPASKDMSVYNTAEEDMLKVPTGVITLTKENNIIEFEWAEKKSVKRLEMWVWPLSAIKNYEIQYYDEALDKWETHSSGELDQTQSIPDPVDPDSLTNTEKTMADEKKSTTAYFMLFDEIVTSKLRFVATDFKDGVTSAKIAEVVPRNSNNVNLLARAVLVKGTYSNGSTYGWLPSIPSSTSAAVQVAGLNESSSPYVLDYGSSMVGNGSDKLTNKNWGDMHNTNGTGNNFWPVYKYSYSRKFVSYSAPSAGIRNFAYTIRFLNSPQMINKITADVIANSGKITKFQILYNKNDSVVLNSTWKTLPDAAADSGWEVATEVTGTFDSNNPLTAIIPGNISAEYWMIKVLESEDGTIETRINVPEFYVYNKDILNEKITGTIKAGETVEFSVESFTNEVPDAKVFFALYENDILSGVKKVDCPLSGSKVHTAKYTIPATADGALKVVAYLWDGKTLEPLVDTPVTAESAPAETPAE